jgi:hypothetical protein
MRGFVEAAMPIFRRRLSADPGEIRRPAVTQRKGQYGPEGMAALRLFMTLVTVLAAALLDVAATAPAQAKVPGANGQIAFTANPDGTNSEAGTDQQKLFVVHPDGSGLHQINLAISGSHSASGSAWSPDGTKIVLRLFLASTGAQHLYTMRATGSDLRPMADTQSSEEFPGWGAPLADTKS